MDFERSTILYQNFEACLIVDNSLPIASMNCWIRCKHSVVGLCHSSEILVALAFIQTTSGNIQKGDLRAMSVLS